MPSKNVGLARRDLDLGRNEIPCLGFSRRLVREVQVLRDHKMLEVMREIVVKYKIDRKDNGIKITDRV